MIKFTSLFDLSISTAFQSLLEFDDGTRILLDVGWDEGFSPADLRLLKTYVPSISYILLTHPTLEHLGAYVHCCKNVPHFTRLPVYATAPVIALGRAFAIDLYQTTPQASMSVPLSDAPNADGANAHISLGRPTRTEIFEYFDLIHALEYSQPHQPSLQHASESMATAVITAYGAGHTIGGTIWHIQHSQESIIYTSGWNQARENLITGAAWLTSASGATDVVENLRRPTALICPWRTSNQPQVVGVKNRDRHLINAVTGVLKTGGKVMIPTDSAGRILELAYVLSESSRDSGTWNDIVGSRSRPRIYIASRSGHMILREVGNMLEWIDENARTRSESAADTVPGGETVEEYDRLGLQHVVCLRSEADIQRMADSDETCIVLASDASLQWGLSKMVLKALAPQKSNLIILTSNGSRASFEEFGVSRRLWELWQAKKTNPPEVDHTAIVSIEETLPLAELSCEPLSASEDIVLREYLARQERTASFTVPESGARAPDMVQDDQDADSDSSDSEAEDQDTTQQGRTLNLSAQVMQNTRRRTGLINEELGVNVLLRSKGVFDYDVRDKRGREKMFPYSWQRCRGDDFGTEIRAEDYLRAEEKVQLVDEVSPRERSAVDAQSTKRRRQDSAAEDDKHVSFEAFATSGKEQLTGGLRQSENQALVPDETISHHDDEAMRGDGLRGQGGDADGSYEDIAQPFKLVRTPSVLKLSLQLAYVDFSGLQDKRDVQMILPLIQPRSLLLLGDSSPEAENFGEECRSLLSTRGKVEVLLPAFGSTVVASANSHAWSVKLSDQLTSKLSWQHVKGVDIVSLTGRLGLQGVRNNEAIDPIAGDHPQKKMKLHEDRPSAMRSTKQLSQVVLRSVDQPSMTPKIVQRCTRSTHVGDLKLASLRQLMISSGHIVEFKGEGTLLIDGTVIVRKTALGHVEVESATQGLSIPEQRTKEMEGTFYAVRQSVYGGLAVLAGA